MDSKVYIYAMGMSQAFFKPNELPVLKQWGIKCANPPHLETVQHEERKSESGSSASESVLADLFRLARYLNIPNTTLAHCTVFTVIQKVR